MGVKCAPYACIHYCGDSEAGWRSRMDREVHQLGLPWLVSFRGRLSRTAWWRPIVDTKARKVWRHRLSSDHGRCGLYPPC